MSDHSKPVRSPLMAQQPIPFPAAITMIYENAQTGQILSVRAPLNQPLPAAPAKRKSKALRNNPTVRAAVKKRTPKRPTGKKSKPVTPAMDKKAKRKTAKS